MVKSFWKIWIHANYVNAVKLYFIIYDWLWISVYELISAYDYESVWFITDYESICNNVFTLQLPIESGREFSLKHTSRLLIRPT